MRRKKIAIATMAAVMALSVCMTGCGKKELDANQYVTTYIEGYNGNGTADCLLRTAIVLDNAELFNGVNSDTVFYDISECLSIEPEQSEGLSNGDVVKFVWSGNASEFEKKYNVKLVYSDITQTVEGLKEGKEINPFDYVQFDTSEIKLRISSKYKHNDETDANSINENEFVSYLLSPHFKGDDGNLSDQSVAVSTLKSGMTFTLVMPESKLTDLEKYSISCTKTEQSYEYKNGSFVPVD